MQQPWTAKTVRGNQRSFSSGSNDYTAQGLLNGVPIAGLVDNRAERCNVSLRFAESHRLSPQDGTQHTVQLGNGKTVSSPGIVSIPWRFSGESESYLVDCAIIPGCVRDLVLGADFLRLTQTLTKFRSRIATAAQGALRRLRLNLLAGEKQRLWGFLDGVLASALPDTGSDVMLVSEEYARSRGLRVDCNPQHCLELELGDGTVAYTSGVVRNLA
ncbi:hypothetical protein B0T26DRAFT_750022 [Lasiosphaeria miniovina]|uniref:Uncharacterized protein n=1 Tax=Lasiosphaeria miniovina TaxID=1954250 RepID=A0AA40AVD0_9PEZI|nr:uncharacterized protein B0T26DRAFT_750022 [Lasiosphaeria miniovina]KAK0722649.1 hypothetical protein B0T26DRAFT_750022 [Lasiosphaeria miniovina]